MLVYKLLKKRNQYDEYVVRCYTNGKYCEEGSYYTDDWEDIEHISIINSLKLTKTGNQLLARLSNLVNFW